MRNTMKCHSIQNKFSAYQDGELRPGEQDEVRKHLLSCNSCREEYEKLGQVWQVLGDLKEIQPDPWFYTQLLRKIKEPREQGFFPRVLWVFRMLRTPAIASILLVVGILVGTYLGSILTQCDFLPFQTTQPTYSQEILFDSLKAFDATPPGTLAHGYLQMVNYKE
jgi:predicted anti-sigma-YlaC factor YlaD